MNKEHDHSNDIKKKFLSEQLEVENLILVCH